MSVRRVFVGLLLVACAAFAYQCESKTFSDGLNVRIPLKDQNDRPSTVEVTQRFELNTSSQKALTIAINCISYMIEKDDYQGLYCGDVVVRSEENGKPGDILFKAPNAICTNSAIASWVAYDSSFRVTLPASSSRRAVMIGLRSSDQYLFLYSSKPKMEPTAISWTTSNLTNKWDDIHMFYGHIGIDADIIVP